MNAQEREKVRADMLEVAEVTEANARLLERRGLRRGADELRAEARRRRRLAASVIGAGHNGREEA